jgi:hypothetical protein
MLFMMTKIGGVVSRRSKENKKKRENKNKKKKNFFYSRYVDVLICNYAHLYLN